MTYYGRHATTVIGYTYEADCHCIACTVKRHAAGGFKVDLQHPHAQPGDDANGVPYAAQDREGNLVHPILADSEPGDAGDYCGECGDEINPAPEPVESIDTLD